MRSGEGRGWVSQMAGYQRGFSELGSEAAKDNKAMISTYYLLTYSPAPLTLSLKGHGCSSASSCRDSTFLSHVNS